MANKKMIYEVTMMFLSLIVVVIAVLQLSVPIPPDTDGILSAVDFVIWIVFVIDYVVRLVRAEDKKKFVLSNKIDLITILPFNSLFRALRVFRATRLLKLLKLLKGLVFLSRFTSKLNVFIKTNNFNYILASTAAIIFLGAGLMSIVENMPFGDAVWWSFVTATTVGYGDISPSTSAGRLIAGVLMLVGIGCIGMLTGTISTFFLTKRHKKSYKEEVIEDIKNRLDDLEHMSNEDIENVSRILKALKENK